MSKAQLKKHLSTLDKPQIIEMVMELYDARKEARDYLDYYVNPNENNELEKFKKIVLKEFDDNVCRNPQCRFSVCRKALSDFKKLAPSADTLAEAMVFYVERVYEFSFCAGDLWEQYYDSAISNFRSTLKYLLKNNLLESMMPRIVQIVAWSWPCGYGFHDETGDTFCELVPLQYHSKVEDADALGEAQYHTLHPDLKYWQKAIKVGMGRSQHEEAKAVECGYWHLWRFNPAEDEAGQNGFHLDSKEPDWSKFQDFIMGEVRYNSLLKTFPAEAKELFAKTEQFAKLRYEGYKKLNDGK